MKVESKLAWIFICGGRFATLSRSVPENLCLQPEKRTVNCLHSGRFQRKPSRVCVCACTVTAVCVYVHCTLYTVHYTVHISSWCGSSFSGMKG
jgi:hypothetical protein